jgi:hypothetical protein
MMTDARKLPWKTGRKKGISDFGCWISDFGFERKNPQSTIRSPNPKLSLKQTIKKKNSGKWGLTGRVIIKVF